MSSRDRGKRRGHLDRRRRRGAHLSPAAILAAALLPLALGALAAGAAAATPTWLAPTDIGIESRTPGGAVESPPDVAIDPAGNVTAVWTHQEGAASDIEAASRPAGGAWEAPADVSGVSEGGASLAGGVAFDAAGDATAIWSAGADPVVRTATRPAGGSWEAPVDVSAAGAAPGSARIAVDPAGNATAIWVQEGGVPAVEAATRPAGGAWGAPVELSAPGIESGEPEIALDGAGDATAVWIESEATALVVKSADRGAGGAWTQPARISSLQELAREPEVALDRSGDAAVTWAGDDGETTIRAATRPAGGSWGSEAELSEPVMGQTFDDVGVDAEGNVTALWATSAGEIPPAVIQSASMPAGGSWGDPVDLSVSGSNIEPDLAVNGAGEAIAVWRTFAGGVRDLQAATRLPGGTWGAPVKLNTTSPGFGEPAVAVDPEGDAAAVWYRGEGIEEGHGTLFAPQAAGLDASAPRLESVSIPRTGTAGRPISLSVSALDVWSRVATTWDFGDGTGGEGASLAHAYARPGTYTATVTATDAVGYSASASGTILISPPTVTPPPGSSGSPTATTAHPRRLRITHRPRRRRRGRADGRPRYAFRFADESPGATYSCSLDGAPFKPCTSPKIYRHLKPGKHVFRVRSVDAEGATSPARSARFVVAGKRG